MRNDTCTHPECGKPVRRKELCYGHYMKLWRYGTTNPDHPQRWADYTGQRFGSLVATTRAPNGAWHCTCDCGASTTARVGDLRRGSISTCGALLHRRQQDAGYSAAHARCETDRGPAKSHQCIDCGQQAQHWSYDHTDPHGRTDSGYAYSLDPTHYSPRCVSCHKRFDLAHLASA